MTAADFAANAAVELDTLFEQLQSDTYHPLPVKAYNRTIKGKTRCLTTPSLRDRVVQRAILTELEPRLPELLSGSCHAYTPGRSTLTAQHHAAALAATGLRHFAHLDIADAFPSADRAGIQAAMSSALDKRTGRVVRAILEAPFLFRGGLRPAASRGIPLGQPLSPVSLNLWLTALDRELEAEGHQFVRYGDDFLLLAADDRALDSACECLRQGLKTRRLSLRMAKATRGVIPADPVPFLGRMLTTSHVLEPVPAPVAGSPLPTPAERAATESTAYDSTSGPALRTLYLQTPGSYVSVRGGCALVSRYGDQLARVPMRDVDRVSVLSTVALSSGFLDECLARSIPLHILSRKGRCFGLLTRSDAERPSLLRAQLESVSDAECRLDVARRLVRAKVAGQAHLLRARRVSVGIRQRLGRLGDPAMGAGSVEQLMGVEGSSTVVYYEGLRACFKHEDMSFKRRTRRPPLDPINSMLSFGYTLLLGEVQSALLGEGLSPFLGYLHTVRDNHPTLASDMMEELRAPLVDRLVLRLANRRQLTPNDFRISDRSGAVLMEGRGRRLFLEEWEAALQQPLRLDGGERPAHARHCIGLLARRMRDYVVGHRICYQPLFGPTTPEPPRLPEVEVRLDEPPASGAGTASITGTAERGEP